MDLQLYEWTITDYQNLVKFLKSEADPKYRDFHASLVPDVSEDFILGIKMPKLREFGKEIAKGNLRSYLKVAGNTLYEERMLKGIVTGLVKTKQFDEFVGLCDDFVKEVNNWAVCDCFCSGLKQTKKFKPEFFEYIEKYLNSENVWEVRVALVIMLNYYLDDEYIDRVLERCDSVKSDFYYVKMAQAWLVATALAQCESKTMAYIKSNSLDDDTFNKMIQKCVESRRISDENKEYLKSLKRH